MKQSHFPTILIVCFIIFLMIKVGKDLSRDKKRYDQQTDKTLESLKMKQMVK